MAGALILNPWMQVRPNSAESPPVNPAAAVCAGNLETARASLHELETGGRAYVLLDVGGREAAAWIARINALPPRTAIRGDAVIAIVTEWSGNVLVAIFDGGCEAFRGYLAPDAYKAIEKAVYAPRGVAV